MDTAVCGENPALLEILLEEDRKNLWKTMDIRISDHPLFDRIEGTPMTVAAALGKTEQIKILLKNGYDPNETGMGTLSLMCYHSTHLGRAGVAVTPLLAAVLMGEEEAAKILLEAGARLELSEPACLRVLMAAGSAAALELIAHLPGGGYEKLTGEERKALEYTRQTREWGRELEEFPL